MYPDDRDAYVERYERRLEQHGHSPLTLGWGRPGREHLRFEVMADVVRAVGAGSVLDVGCGFGDLLDHLRAAGWPGRYVGIDVVPGLVREARTRLPDVEIDVADIRSYREGEADLFDVAVASGVFNARLENEDNAQHVERSIARMVELARRAVVVDFMTSHVDYVHPDAWHADAGWAIEVARRFTRRFAIRHDYLPFEFALVLYLDDAHQDSVFRPLGA